MTGGGLHMPFLPVPADRRSKLIADNEPMFGKSGFVSERDYGSCEKGWKREAKEDRFTVNTIGKRRLTDAIREERSGTVDQGCPYTGAHFVNELEANDITQMHEQTGNLLGYSV